MVVGVLNVLLDALAEGSFGRRQRLHRMATRTDVQQLASSHDDDADDDTTNHHEEQDNENKAGDAIVLIGSLVSVHTQQTERGTRECTDHQSDARIYKSADGSAEPPGNSRNCHVDPC